MTALNIATTDDLDRLMRLVGDHHAERGVEQTEEARRAAILPLLEGSPHGTIYLIGPARAPIGYIAISFGWSIGAGGMDGLIGEFYIRPGVRGRGIGTEIMHTLPRALAKAGLKAMHLEIGRDDARARKLYEKLGFRARGDVGLMSRRF
ncbi:MAG: GNAT family N-acetyltransferase [Roseovarius sp.]|nr:GNAT family N-acetyltransferase [Roseovarius sp.]